MLTSHDLLLSDTPATQAGVRSWWQVRAHHHAPKLPAVNPPFADKLPKPEEVVANAYDFAEQLLASQRKFAEEVLKATAALMPGHAS